MRFLSILLTIFLFILSPSGECEPKRCNYFTNLKDFFLDPYDCQSDCLNYVKPEKAKNALQSRSIQSNSLQNYTKPDKDYEWFKNFYRDVLCDYSIYYGKENLPWLGGMLVAAGLMANTKFDHSIHHHWQTHRRNHFSNHFFKIPHGIGGYNYIKFYVSTILVGYWQRDTIPGNLLYQWGYRSLRALLIVSPQEVLLSNQLRSGRPSRGNSHWRIGKKIKNGKGGKEGCSGHAFNGALPFLTMAFMTEEPLYRYGFFALSTLPGLCRINDDRHYFHQIFIGWTLSFLATRVVAIADEEREKSRCKPHIELQFKPVDRGIFIRGVLEL